MKKIIFAVLSVLLSFTIITPISAEDIMKEESTSNSEEVRVSDVMSYDEMVQTYAKEMKIPLIKAYKEFASEDGTSLADVRAATYRELSVGLDVAANYHPSIRFFCNTSESGNYWGITSIYKVTLNRNYNGTTRQFAGEIDCWLRSAYQIEWYVNGDFYNNGTTNFSGGASGSWKLNEKITIQFSISGSYSSSHFAYYYNHITTSFQS